MNEFESPVDNIMQFINGYGSRTNKSFKKLLCEKFSKLQKNEIYPSIVRLMELNKSGVLNDDVISFIVNQYCHVEEVYTNHESLIEKKNFLELYDMINSSKEYYKLLIENHSEFIFSKLEHENEREMFFENENFMNMVAVSPDEFKNKFISKINCRDLDTLRKFDIIKKDDYKKFSCNDYNYNFDCFMWFVETFNIKKSEIKIKKANICDDSDEDTFWDDYYKGEGSINLEEYSKILSYMLHDNFI